MKHKVYAELPKTGLGNMLLIWSRAKVFSHINGIPLITSSWWGLRPGTWIRNENKKRTYWGYFHESSLRKRIAMHVWKRMYPSVSEPPVKKTPLPEKPVIFRFSVPVTQNDLFDGVKPYRAYIKEEVYKLLKPKLVKQLAALPAPEISVHIRRGDFKLGSTITPNSFFIRCIQFIRSETKKNLPVTVFTDATTEEIKDVLQMANVHLAKKKPDILDVLQMSRSKVIVLSQTSTFSYWAAFLSDAIIIKPFGDWYADIRPPEVNQIHFEGKVDFEFPDTLSPLKEGLLQEFS
jgi:hypothetical protein